MQEIRQKLLALENKIERDKPKKTTKPESLTAAEYSSVGLNYHDLFYNGKSCESKHDEPRKASKLRKGLSKNFDTAQ